GCCSFAGMEPSGRWDDTFSLTWGRYNSGPTSKIEATLISYDVDLSVPYSNIEVASAVSTAASFTEPELRFEDACLETCLLPSLNTSNISLSITVDNASVEIDAVLYTLKEQQAISRNPPSIIKNMTAFTLFQGETKTLSLSEFFTDLDGDNITYAGSASDGLEINIDEENAAIFYSATSESIAVEILETPTPISDVAINATTRQGQVIINQPARWSTTVKVTGNVYNLSVSIPPETLNVTVIDLAANETLDDKKILVNDSGSVKNVTIFEAEKRIGQIEKQEHRLSGRKISIVRSDPANTDDIGKLNRELLSLQNERNDLTGFVVASRPAKGLLTRFLEWLLSRDITGFAVAPILTQEENQTAVIIEDVVKEVSVEYYTEGPISEERQITAEKKQVTISSEIHYENILAFTSIPESRPSMIMLSWLVNGTRKSANITRYEDTNNDSTIDKIYWIVPSLSNQTYEISLTLLNVQSYPMVGGNWSVAFNTTGYANLTIRAFNGTTYTEYFDDNATAANDLMILELRCGSEVLFSRDGNISAGISIILRNGSEASLSETFNKSLPIFGYKAINFSCNETANHTVFVQTDGKHYQLFEFGNISKEAKNDAAGTQCGSPATGSNCNILTGGADNTCIDTDANNAMDSTDYCHSNTECYSAHIGASCDYYTGVSTVTGICVQTGDTSGDCSATKVSGEYGTGLSGGTAPNFHSGNENQSCGVAAEMMICNITSGYDAGGGDLCLDQTCLDPADGIVSFSCIDQTCSTSDVTDGNAFGGCNATAAGWACDSSLGSQGFSQDGQCSITSGFGTYGCATSGYNCNASSGPFAGLLFKSGCGVGMECIDGDTCDATLTDGNYLKTYGTCSGTSCVASGGGDSTPPTITIVSPKMQNYTNRTIYFNISINENASNCSFSLDGALNVSMNNTNKTWYNFTNTSMATGLHNITFTCNDTANNFNSTFPTRHFRVNINESCTTGNGCFTNFGYHTCMDSNADNVPDICINESDYCHLYVGASCNYYDGAAATTLGICALNGANRSRCNATSFSGEYGLGLSGGSAADFHSGDENSSCTSAAEAMICTNSSGGYSPNGTSICVEDSCIAPLSTISVNCLDQTCATSDVTDATVQAGCFNAYACDSSINGSGFTQDGICIDITCTTSGHLCNSSSGTLYQNGCGGGAQCIDNDPCDSTLTDGNFDKSYGVCSGTSCLTAAQQPPVLTIFSPLHYNYTSRLIEFNVSANKNVSNCSFSLDGALNISMNNTNKTWYNFTNASVQTGLHNITFYCNDTSNNMGNSSNRKFRVILNETCTTGAACKTNFGSADMCLDTNADNTPESCNNESTQCANFLGSSCDLNNGTKGICINQGTGICAQHTIVSGEYGTGLSSGTAITFHSGNESTGCNATTEAMVCNSLAVADYNPAPIGICFDSSCTNSSNAVLNCIDHSCDVADVSNAAFTTCASSTNGWACTVLANGSGFIQEGVCAYNSSSALNLCQNTSHVCNASAADGITYSLGCGVADQCRDFDPCYSNTSIGNFNATYGYCNGAVCQKFGPNIRPSISLPVFNDTSLTSNDDLTANATFTDTNSNRGTITFIWYVNNTKVHNETFVFVNTSNITSSRLSQTNYSVTDRINVSAYANDGTDTSLTNFSITLTVANGAPIITTPVLNDSRAYSHEDLSANVTYTDSDGDAGTVYFRWYVNGSNVWNQTFSAVAHNRIVISNFSATNYSRGSQVNATVYANDGTDNSATAMTSSQTIPNHPPSQAVPILNSTSKTNTTSENLFCYNQSTFDGDDDYAKNSYAWYKNSTLNATFPRMVNPPVAYLPFDRNETLADVFDYAFDQNATQMNEAKWIPGGKVEGAYQFDGTDDYIDAGNRSAYNTSRTDEVTVEAWFNALGDGSLGETHGYIADNYVNQSKNVLPSGTFSKIAHVSGNIYAVSYNSNGTNITTFTILPNGTVSTRIDTAYVGAGNTYTELKKIADGVLAVATNKELVTVTINGSGTITNERFDNFTISQTSSANHPSMTQVSGNVYAIIREVNGNINLTTISITSGGAIGDPIETVNVSGGYGAAEPKIIPISGTTYLFGYQVGDPNIMEVKTIDIQNDGDIASGITDNLTISTGLCNGGSTFPFPISGTVYGVAFQSCAGNGYLRTINIHGNGTIDDRVIQTFVYDSDSGDPEVLKVAGDIFLIAISADAGNNEFFKTVRILQNGTIEGLIDSKRGGAESSGHPSPINVSDYVFATIDARVLTTIRIDRESGIYKPGAFMLDADTNYAYARINGITRQHPITPGWHHLAVTYDVDGSQNQKFYVDGAIVQQYNQTASQSVHAKSLTIGKFFNGTIDEVVVYNRSLSPTEVSQHYQAGRWYENTRQISIMNHSETRVGDVWVCEITPYDYIENGTSRNSTSMSILGAETNPPEMSIPILNDTTVYYYEDIMANTTYTDGENDLGTVNISWLRNNIPIFNQTFTSVASGTLISANLSSANFTVTDQINVSAIATDGTNNSVRVFSTNLTIKPNSIPAVSTPLFNDSSPYYFEDLMANTTY
ncbi:LamG domain-containing protein, partial [Candidatus Woesearchaeota archaeon]|nr:LamG domain-containing protein [Candidatus Woesearchaeota archaeon]